MLFKGDHVCAEMGDDPQRRREFILETVDVTARNGENDAGDRPESRVFEGKFLGLPNQLATDHCCFCRIKKKKQTLLTSQFCLLPLAQAVLSPHRSSGLKNRNLLVLAHLCIPASPRMGPP